MPSDVLGGEVGDEKEEREEKPGSSSAGREEKTVPSHLVHALQLAFLTGLRTVTSVQIGF